MTTTRSLAIIDEQARHRSAFEAFCRSLPPDELATLVPGAPWTVHGYIAHLATIDSLVAPFLAPLVAMTDVPRPEVPPPAPFDIDEWNEAMVPLRADASVDELFSEAARHRAQYARVLSALTDAQLDMMIPFGGDRKVIDLPPTQVRLEDLLWAIALHDPNHTQDILRAIPHREPDVRDWLASCDFARIPDEITARRA
ncbi:MAG: DinB family protein [Vicinamibacterales bacterium]